MKNYVEHEVEIECPKCGHLWIEHMEFDFQNRTEDLVTDWREVECECGNKFEARGHAHIDIDHSTRKKK
jgi:Zn-finger nucleic acid-binding protein